jgi:transposase-like protein
MIVTTLTVSEERKLEIIRYALPFYREGLSIRQIERLMFYRWLFQRQRIERMGR